MYQLEKPKLLCSFRNSSFLAAHSQLRNSKEESSVTYNMEPSTIGLIQKLQKNALNGKTAGILLAMLIG